MGTRITDQDGNERNRAKYPAVKIGCLNTRAHPGYGIVEFLIPAGRKNAKCPACGRRAGRK